MSKISKLLLLTSAVLLSGCTPKTKNTDKVVLYYKDTSITEIIELDDVNEVDFMIEAKDNFILVSYADYTCSCWGTFRDFVLNPFIKEENIPIYVIHTDLLEGDYRDLPINRGKSNTPVIGLYKEGEYVRGENYENNGTIFKNLEQFKGWIDRYVTLPIMTYISLEELNTKIKGTESFIINWSFNICPDCKLMDKKLIPQYMADNTISEKLPYYLIETATIRKQSNWVEVKNTYGLSNVLNTEKGYNGGYVPTLQVIEPNGTDYVAQGDISPIIKDMLVFQNEFVEKVDGKFKISDSYWNGVRGTNYLGTYESEIGKEVDASIVEETPTRVSLVPGSRYTLNANYTAKFLDYYWK